MAKHRTRKEKSKTGRIQQRTGTPREKAGRRMRAAPKVKAKVKAQNATKTKSPVQSLLKTVAGTNRAEGIKLFKLAGRPSKPDFIRVYGERGPRMTWGERAKAGVSAKQFQTALKAKLAEKAVSRPPSARSAVTTTQTATPPLAGT